MKLVLLVSLLENANLGHEVLRFSIHEDFVSLRKCKFGPVSTLNSNFTKYIEKESSYCRRHLESIYKNLFFKEDCILAFINLFSFCERKIRTMPNDLEMERVDFNSLLKMNSMCFFQSEILLMLLIPGNLYAVNIF